MNRPQLDDFTMALVQAFDASTENGTQSATGWAPPPSVYDLAIGIPLLGLFWLFAGPLGLLAGIIIAVSWAVLPAVVPIAIGVLAMSTLLGEGNAVLVVTGYALLSSIFLADGVKSEWDLSTGIVFTLLTVSLGATVFFLTDRLGWLGTAAFLCAVVIVGALVLAQLAPVDEQDKELKTK